MGQDFTVCTDHVGRIQYIAVLPGKQVLIVCDCTGTVDANTTDPCWHAIRAKLAEEVGRFEFYACSTTQMTLGEALHAAPNIPDPAEQIRAHQETIRAMGGEPGLGMTLDEILECVHTAMDIRDMDQLDAILRRANPGTSTLQ